MSKSSECQDIPKCLRVDGGNLGEGADGAKLYICIYIYINTTPARDPKQVFETNLKNHGREINQEESWMRSPGGILEEESWRRNHGGGIIEEESWRRHLGEHQEPSGKHLGSIWEAPGSWEASGKHLGGIWEGIWRSFGRGNQPPIKF
jgi:hypothetical protein